MEVKTFFAQSADGKVIPDAEVSVHRLGEENVASNLEDANGNPLDNPFRAGPQGQIQFAAPNGRYSIEVASQDSRQRLNTQFFDQTAVMSASGIQTLSGALDQRLIVLDSVEALREWPGERVPDGCRLICRSFYHDLPYELNIELQRSEAQDSPDNAGDMAWVPAPHPVRDDFHVLTLWAKDGSAYVQRSYDINLLKVGFRADYRLTDGTNGKGSDESRWFQETLDKTPYRTKYLPDLPGDAGLYLGNRRITLCSGTRIVGDGAHANSRLVSDYAATGFHDGLFWLREPHVIDAWANGRPTGELDAAFSHGIHLSGLTIEATDFARGAVALVCVRDVTYNDIHHLRCGGLKIFHELELNDRYSIKGEDPDTDNAVTAGFNPDAPDDLSEGIRVSNLSGSAGRYTFKPGDSKRATAVRLNFVRDFSVSHVHMDYCNVSGWGGSARAGKGGELKWMRRLRDGFIQDVHCRWTNGAIYFNNAHNVKVFGCSAKEVSDTAFDLEGCTYCLFDGIYAENAANFGISIFYATRGNVIKNFVARQTSQSASIHARFAEPKFGPGLGKTLFRRLAGFEDPDFDQDVTLDTGAFLYEGEGFGAVIVDSWADVTYRNINHSDIVVDLRAHSNAQSQTVQDCRFTFTKPAADNDVLIALGTNRDAYGSWKGGSIVSAVEQPAGVVPLLSQLRTYAGVAIYDIDDLRIDVPGVRTAIMVCDARKSGRHPGHAFRLNRNLIPPKSLLVNLNLNEITGGGPAQLDITNNRSLDFAPIEMTAVGDDSNARHATLRFGLSVARGKDI
ncbi:right-handed parallel beta-helix repeat-containing protein [Salinicola corii]|uniref:Right-handed parallel beta-helix repeat-containing protein n=1 Tax=Salinicola corii TaxID=2606937 RepID=A0A640WGF3_9GAMM|nr:right-handed parallel beta-helix repeat-containing protein [Salinicola corii]KAA0019337.1 right-handed parallel beta-helix repeat-containing protein [Salinicola corii]